MSIRTSTKYIVLHCSATRAKLAVTAAQIREWHKAQGWTDIGYHYVIRRDGKVEAGRAENAVGAHVGGHNSNTLAICLVGGLNDATGRPEDNFTDAQKAAAVKLVRELLTRYPGALILGHRDLSPDKDKDGVVEPGEWLKMCPCFDARSFAKAHGLPPAPVRL